MLIVLIGGPSVSEPPIAGQEIPNNEPEKGSQTMSIVATLTGESDAVWEKRPGQDLYSGQRFTLTHGMAEITTHRGAVAILEAPSTIEFIDHENAIRLHAGKLVGICETLSSKGFVVRTAHMDITDLGTEFGVEVAGKDVTTTVFTGEVELTVPDSEPQPLTANQTARLTADDTRQSLVIEDRLAQGFDALHRLPLVTGAHINDDRLQVEVVLGGVREDVKIRTNRNYELNGLDAKGIPSVLLDGDLVRTPGHPKDSSASSVKVEIELSELADIYVLVKADQPPPGWLARDYTLTPLQVGIDRNHLGVGPGESIDVELAVWVRNNPAVDRVLVAEEMQGESSYTIIAVPTNRDTPIPSTQE